MANQNMIMLTVSFESGKHVLTILNTTRKTIRFYLVLVPYWMIKYNWNYFKRTFENCVQFQIFIFLDSYVPFSKIYILSYFVFETFHVRSLKHIVCIVFFLTLDTTIMLYINSILNKIFEKVNRRWTAAFIPEGRWKNVLILRFQTFRIPI